MLGLDPEARPAALGIRMLKLGALHPSTATPCAGWPRASRPCSSSRTSSRSSRRSSATRSTAPRTSRPSSASATSPAQPLVPLTGAVDGREPRRAAPPAAWPRRSGPERLAPRRTAQPLALTVLPEALRTPFFCSGCPHNTGTKVPEGALVGAGIGCHGMITLMGAAGRGEIIGITPDGRRGRAVDRHRARSSTTTTSSRTSATAPSSTRARSPSRPPSPPASTMTFKLLYNAAVAMTGGQDATGLPAGARSWRRSCCCEGVHAGHHHHRRARTRTAACSCPTGVRGVAPRPHHRGAGAAAHGARRDRAHPRPAVRGREAPRPQAGPAADAGDQRIVIDERVCEGCGDCGVQVELPAACSRSTPSSAARPRSTRPAATSTTAASRATARPS